ncbi:succinyl-CoA ligase subunit beta [Candidatus Photodesmus katoptron]|uniref:Succinate--CoA ligase [ADP-forming] subunit beta n=1 Tax=Candidatus Photodesmus katoptron Akat1 TaxID=1236703 RepID=S3E0E2_9GAMM|nr:ADP-forming succinate--CoA ligase subunit beta [Candidatus Photodesmus katoptron]EPE37661.1 succinyl-CoA ligase subunit beta [Candidatus Photodesmus katoptron Akat1]KEY90619.1 succinyl-CoA ligase subunit beta [Candidatus Photodesmus katoptron]
MNLHEYQAKQLFSEFGLSIPEGYVCDTPQKALESAGRIVTKKKVVKCQVHSGGRGKAGAVKICDSKDAVKKFSENWLGKRLLTYQTDSKGQPVEKILVEESINIISEFYLGAIIDRVSCSIVFMVSTEGGVQIEEIAKNTPHLIHKVSINPFLGPQEYQGRELAFKLSFRKKEASQFVKIFISLVDMFIQYDLSLLEINPLVITNNKKLLCLDGKISFDSNAIYRQPKLSKMYDVSQENEREVYAAKLGLNYIPLNGNIGCLVNGAGLAMGTMDMIHFHGAQPANFLDIGGSATKERVTEAFKIILSDINVKAILVNIFGGIVCCDLVADGIVNAVKEIGIDLPVVVRLEGNNSSLGAKKLRNSTLKLIVANSLSEAAKKVISVSGINDVYLNK